ncbi:MAG: exodeoxyribonuclease VII small subunit [Microbacteriaceae bacterium]|nr:exodeoxyribonuclease VII small subunit [Microbacteriaceae bacterium]
MNQEEISQLSYEAARDALAEIVTKLETGTSTLEESVSLWETGEALARRCEDLLSGAKSRLEQARANLEHTE